MKLNVFINLEGQRHFVGRLQDAGHRIFFEYAAEFLTQGLDLSPFYLPLKTGVFEEQERLFDGLFGLFNDSLPDGWGVLLLDRKLRNLGLSWESITPLHRLSLIGANPMGALEYEPCEEVIEDYGEIKLDSLANDINSFMAGSCDQAILDHLAAMNGSSCGARPKSILWLSPDHKTLIHGGDDTELQGSGYTQWIVKFMEKNANKDAGLWEYRYSLAAGHCGITIPPVELFPSEKCDGYFGIQRFDRNAHGKVHTHTACGLLHASHRLPSIDYENLLKLTRLLTQDQEQVEEMVRRMIFNVIFENRDDHSKNFTFMLGLDKHWRLAPAYDLTPSAGINGEQTTMVNGKGKNIGDDDFVVAASKVSVPEKKVREYVGIIRDEWQKMKSHSRGAELRLKT